MLWDNISKTWGMVCIFSYEYASIGAINGSYFMKRVISTVPGHAYSTLR